MRKKSFIKFPVAMVTILLLVVAMIPNGVFAGENAVILAENKKEINKLQDDYKSGFDITNDYSKLKYVHGDTWNMFQPDYYELYTVKALGKMPEGIFYPEALLSIMKNEPINLNPELPFQRVATLGVTGTEIELTKKYLEQCHKEDPKDQQIATDLAVFNKLNYVVGDMQIADDSTKKFVSASDKLAERELHIKANMKQFMDFSRMFFTSDTHHEPSDLVNALVCEVKLPNEISVTAKSNEELKKLITVNGDFFKVKTVQLNGNVLKIHLQNIIKNYITFGLKGDPNNPSDDLPDNLMDINIGIKGLKYRNSVKLSKDYTIKSAISGITATGKNGEVVYDYAVYSIKQDVVTKDSSNDLGGIISATVGIKHNTVTFKVKNKDASKVLVEKGKAIEKDIDKTQSMPVNPTKKGYTFKGWNTKSDGSGKTFTGNTIVKGDVTVYAIFTKNGEQSTQKPPKNKKGDSSGTPKTGDDTNFGQLILLITLSSAVLVAMAMKRKKS